jgi:hypothetical protein
MGGRQSAATHWRRFTVPLSALGLCDGPYPCLECSTADRSRRACNQALLDVGEDVVNEHPLVAPTVFGTSAILRRSEPDRRLANGDRLQVLRIRPTRSAEGTTFADELLRQTREELVERFGGLTAYTRSATGVWTSPHGDIKEDRVVMIEVLSGRFVKDWWRSYAATLKKRFRQETMDRPGPSTSTCGGAGAIGHFRRGADRCAVDFHRGGGPVGRETGVTAPAARGRRLRRGRPTDTR